MRVLGGKLGILIMVSSVYVCMSPGTVGSVIYVAGSIDTTTARKTIPNTTRGIPYGCVLSAATHATTLANCIVED